MRYFKISLHTSPKPFCKSMIRGSNLVEVVVAIGVIGMGSLLMMDIYSNATHSTSRMKSKLAFASIRNQVLAVLQNAASVQAAAAGGLKACLSSDGTADCRDGDIFSATFKESGSQLNIISAEGAYYTPSGQPTADKSRAAFIAKIDGMVARCNVDDAGVTYASCDKAAAIDTEFSIEPIAENYKLLSLPSSSALYINGKFNDRFVYKGFATASFNSFKISKFLTVPDCNAASTYAGSIGGSRHKFFNSDLGNPKNPDYVLVGISNVSTDAKTAKPICFPTAGYMQKPIQGEQGPKGPQGYRGPTGPPGPVGFRATVNGSHTVNWATDYGCCLNPRPPEPNYP